MFGRNKESAVATPLEEQSPQARDPRAGKGVPTPSRKEQEAARKRPLIPQDRSAAKVADREKRREDQLKMRAAMDTGDERYLPLRDKGPQKRLVRDIVDARTSLGEFVMFLALLIVVVSFALPIAYQSYTFVIFWVYVILVAIESFFLSRKIRKVLTSKFGEVERGTVWYGVMRSLQFRRLRLPKPQVKRGTKLNLN